MKKIILSIGCTLIATPTFACVFCNKAVSDGIYDSAFYPNILAMLSAFIAVAIIVAILYIVATKRQKIFWDDNTGIIRLTPVPLATTSVIIGIGLGGFADGIFLHQILQWHEMLSNRIPPTNYVGKSINMFWDGIFHAFCLVVVLSGTSQLWKLLKRNDINTSGYLYSGGVLAGWGLFNIVEGLIDHQILKLHNVMELAPNHDIANYAFLGISVVMLLVGYFLMQRGAKE
ncbi:MAG TPA: DUF2243 domain-containing protein [Flavobacterium sp.]|jgi:uncharacterized membrane protein